MPMHKEHTEKEKQAMMKGGKMPMPKSHAHMSPKEHAKAMAAMKGKK